MIIDISRIGFYLLVFLVLVFLGVVFISRYYSYRRKRQNGITFGAFLLFSQQCKLVHIRKEWELSVSECKLLLFFIEHPNTLLSYSDLLAAIDMDTSLADDRILAGYVQQLRRKLSIESTIQIHHIEGVGYQMEFQNDKE